MVESGQGIFRLHAQYRCHAAIGRALQFFYADIQLEHRAEHSRDYLKHLQVNGPLGDNVRICLLDSTYKPDQREYVLQDDNHLVNFRELQLLLDLLSSIVDVLRSTRTSRKTVRILTPYRNQLYLIEKLVALLPSWYFDHVLLEPGTIDGSQGCEANITIVTLVRCNLNRTVGFLGEIPGRVLVPMSRSRDYLFLIGNFHTLTSDSLWSQLVTSLLAQGGTIIARLIDYFSIHRWCFNLKSLRRRFEYLPVTYGSNRKCGDDTW
jgi:superfamily I DNA and/or RNA helicase